MEEEVKLPIAEYYLNKINGDILITWYASNRPTNNDWVRISESCYNIITDN